MKNQPGGSAAVIAEDVAGVATPAQQTPRPSDRVPVLVWVIAVVFVGRHLRRHGA